jgi:hypothetical protein
MSSSATAPISIAVTAVRWSWWDDKQWVAYDAATNAALEQALARGERRIAVDAERFVDVDFADNAAIQRCLANADPALVGVQRRKDDESRRRAVRRVVPELFAAHLFLPILADKPRAAAQLHAVATHAGLTAATWKKAVTAVLLDDAALADVAHRDLLRKAVAANVPLLHVAVIDDVVAGRAWPAAAAARSLDAQFAALLAADASTTTTSTTTATSSTSSASKRKTSSSTSSTGTAKKSKSVVSAAAVAASSSVDLRPLLQVSTSFDGLVRYSDGDEYAFALVIDAADAAAGAYVGVATWPKLDAAETEWSITLSPAGAFEARELKAGNPSAAAFVALGAVYTGMLSDKGDLLMGAVVDADGAALSPSFRLTHNANLGKAVSKAASASTAMATDDNDDNDDDAGAADAAVPTVVLPLATAKRTYKGFATLRLPFTLTVDGSVGKLDWTLGGSVSEAVEVAGERFAMRKAKGRAPSLALPSEFDGKVSGDTVSGTVENGTFEMHVTP